MIKKYVFLLLIISIISSIFSMSVRPKYITPSKKYHIVKKGDTLQSVSAAHNISIKKLKLFNDLKEDRIFVGQKIYLIPNIQPKNEFITIRKIPENGYHIVQKGEDIFTVLKMYQIDIVDLIDMNDLDDLVVIEGEKIYLTKNQKKTVHEEKKPTKIPEFHIIRYGDNLTKISKKYGVSISDLKKNNNLNSDNIQAGRKLFLKNANPAYAKESVTSTPKKVSPKSSKSKTSKKVTSKKAKKEIPKKVASINTKNLKKVYLPVKGIVTSEYGMRNKRIHKGIDIAGKVGTPIHAALDGTVAYTGKQKGYGNVVILKHKNDVMTIYAHNNANLVRKNDKIKKGQPIATLGNSGRSTGPHLHFEYRLNGKAINPRKILPEF